VTVATRAASRAEAGEDGKRQRDQRGKAGGRPEAAKRAEPTVHRRVRKTVQAERSIER
jgi:hypothetical protein